MITCTRRLQFCAGHRVMGHEGKCAHLHGHNYVVLLTARGYAEDSYRDEDFGGAKVTTRAASSELDGIGRVVDFSVLKARVGAWIEKHWDHGFLLCEADAAGAAALAAFDRALSTVATGERVRAQKRFELPYNPTAENVARYLVDHVGPVVLAGEGVELVRAEVWETENCRAEYAKEGA